MSFGGSGFGWGECRHNWQEDAEEDISDVFGSGLWVRYSRCLDFRDERPFMGVLCLLWKIDDQTETQVREKPRLYRNLVIIANSRGQARIWLFFGSYSINELLLACGDGQERERDVINGVITRSVGRLRIFSPLRRIITLGSRSPGDIFASCWL